MLDFLKSSLDKFNQVLTLLENIPVLVYMKDNNRNYLTGSKYAEDFVFNGFDKYSDKVQINMEACDAMTKEEDNYVLENKKMLIKEKSAVDYNGIEHWYKILKAPIFDKNNDISGLVTIAQNIDAEKQLENQKDLFIATLVHDLKNPLYAQTSCINLLRKGTFGELNDAQNEILDNILESQNAAMEMLLNILNTYKYKNGILKLEPENIDVIELLKKCIKEINGVAKDRNVNIVMHSNLKNNNVYVDKKQIRRVLANLFNNGIRYAFQNTDFVINLYEDNENVYFKVTNESPEIDDDIKNSIFNKYVSGVSQYKQIGFGLGMYLSKKIIDAHGGTISLDANGTSNSFIFTIPKSFQNKELETHKIVW